MGLPDTVNDARVRALVEPLGTIVKLHLQPSRGGARIEFADAAVAGKAGLQLDGLDYEGHKLRTGSGDELRSAKAATTQVKKPKDAKHLAPTTALRRPGAQKSGPKRGVGSINAKSSTGSSGGTGAAANQKSAPKSNADFKAMFLTGANGDKGKTQEGENGT
jgi:RNA recognition motif-containing protein